MKESCVEKDHTVAPFAGAWIEIVINNQLSIGFVSHPSRVRGLKYVKTSFLLTIIPSHPSRVRGLKFGWSAKGVDSLASHPSRVRGLKCDNNRKSDRAE